MFKSPRARAHILVALMVWAGLTETLAASPCLRMPEGGDDSPIMVCSADEGYLFKRGAEETFYAKADYEAYAQGLIERWLSEAGLETARLCGAALSLWLAVPESDPLGVQLRLVVEAAKQPFVVFLPWLPAEWVVNSYHAAILESAPYPRSYGYRTASLMVKKARAVRESGLHTYLARFGMQVDSSVGGDWWAYRLAPFQERATLARLQSDLLFSFWGEDATLNPILEWTAYRAKAFSFPWICRED